LGFSLQEFRMNEIIFLVTGPPEGGYAAEAPGHAIFTTASRFDELTWMARDAVVCHFKEDMRPKTIRLHFVRD
jgi:hypothetical protein